jgi:hypothetical protein
MKSFTKADAGLKRVGRSAAAGQGDSARLVKLLKSPAVCYPDISGLGKQMHEEECAVQKYEHQSVARVQGPVIHCS